MNVLATTPLLPACTLIGAIIAPFNAIATAIVFNGTRTAFKTTLVPSSIYVVVPELVYVAIDGVNLAGVL